MIKFKAAIATRKPGSVDEERYARHDPVRAGADRYIVRNFSDSGRGCDGEAGGSDEAMIELACEQREPVFIGFAEA